MHDTAHEGGAARHGGRQGGGGGRGGGLGSGALLGPAVIAVLGRESYSLDEIARRLDVLSEGKLAPDGAQLAEALADLERQGFVRSGPSAEPGGPRTWRVTPEGHVRLLAVSERLRERVRLAERIIDALGERGGR